MKRLFCCEIVFHPFAGLFISKSCLSPHIKQMINETKNTSMNGALLKAVKNRILQLL